MSLWVKADDSVENDRTSTCIILYRREPEAAFMNSVNAHGLPDVGRGGAVSGAADKLRAALQTGRAAGAPVQA
jgi:hypothetical protein